LDIRTGNGGAGGALPADTPQLPAHREIELKLVAPPGTLERCRAADVIARHARNRGIVRRLEATYYDTSDHKLFDHDLSLRVRRNGRKCIQTLKQAPPDGDPLVRGEWEAPVAGVAPELARLPTAEIGTPLEGLSEAALLPVFATKVRRRIQNLELPGAVLEIAFDEGTIEAGAKSSPLAEIEIELKAGDPGALYDLALDLLDVAPLRIGHLSKSDRGYALAFGTQPLSVKAAGSSIATGDNCDDAIGKIVASCQRHLMANEAVAEDGRDVEGVHQMRVALRRLRTALSMMRRDVPAPSFAVLGSEAKWIAGILGPARNWDVFATETLPGIAAACPGVAGFEALGAAAAPLREESYAKLRAALAEPRFGRFLLTLGRFVERRGWRSEITSDALAVLSEPADALAGRALSRVHRKALKRGAHFRRLEAAERHELRLNLKKLRYTAEFFVPLFEGKSAKQYLKRLSGLQDALGADNDAVTTLPLMRDIERTTADPAVHRALGAVIGWQTCRRSAAADRLHAAWQEFEAARPFWR
jgi:triphosphatase